LFSRFCAVSRVFLFEQELKAAKRFRRGAQLGNMLKGNGISVLFQFPAQHRNRSKRLGNQANPNVSNILPVTTLRTIDLAGREISDRLFSRFCAGLTKRYLSPKINFCARDEIARQSD
jgi:hypothetical protein